MKQVKRGAMITKQYEWLDLLPLADYFYLNWLACDASGVWYQTAEKPQRYTDTFCPKNGLILQIDPAIMPALTCDEWGGSLISIDDLDAYQKQAAINRPN